MKQALPTSSVPAYAIAPERRKQLAGTIVLHVMAARPAEGGVISLPESSKSFLLFNHLTALKATGLIEPAPGLGKYTLTQAGTQSVAMLRKRHSEYLQVFDVFAYVDLETGEFAFEKYYETSDVSENSWKAYKMAPRFEDLRIAVAELKGMDPVDIVIMQMIADGAFGEGDAWQAELSPTSLLWAEIERICNTNIHKDQLGYADHGVAYASEDVLAEVIRRGAAVMFEVSKEDKRRRDEYAAQQAAAAADTVQAGDTEVVTTTEVIETVEFVDEDYFPEPYLDPYYLDPVWALPVIVWTF